MTIFAILTKPDAGPEALEAVPEKFVWSAFIFAPLWALFHRAFGFLALWFALVLVLYAAHFVLGATINVLAYGLFALWAGFAAPQIKTYAMQRQGWMTHGELTAIDVESAERVWLERNYGARI